MRKGIPVTLLTLNTHKGFTLFNRRFVLSELKSAVEAIGADVVMLQETLGSDEVFASRQAAGPTGSQYEYLASRLWRNVAYGKNAVYTKGHHGNAVLSRFPILRFENHDISIAGYEQRGLLHCVLGLPKESAELHVLCTHLGLKAAERTRQLKQIAKFVVDEIPADAPLVLAGDFNDWRVRANGTLDAVGLVEAFNSKTGRCAKSFPALWPILRLDRIYVKKVEIVAVAVLSARPWRHLSDHAALTSTIEL